MPSDAIRRCPIEPNTLLVTFYVKSLYTCIPHQEGIAACNEALSSTQEDNSERPDIFVLIYLLEIVLKITHLSLTTNSTNNFKVLQWELNYPQPMQTSSWANRSMNLSPMHLLNLFL